MNRRGRRGRLILLLVGLSCVLIGTGEIAREPGALWYVLQLVGAIAIGCALAMAEAAK